MKPPTFDELCAHYRSEVAKKARRGYAPDWWYSRRHLTMAFRGHEPELAELVQMARLERQKRGIPEGVRS